jgi:hypothetical protein
MRRGGFERFELVGLEQHVLALRELVAFDDFLARHDFAAARVDELLLQSRAVFLVHLVEMDLAGGLARGIELHRNGDQSEGNRGS